MRLFDAIIDANHRTLAGESSARLNVADFEGHLPVVALTCIDPRLNRFFPGVVGLPEVQFIWLRNAGNVIASPLSSTMRSLALACAIKGGREIAVIGHTDCAVRQTTVSQLTERFKALGIERQQLPENLVQYFGLFASERQNVICGVDFVRQSPLIGRQIPVHGLLIETDTGRLQWVVNGYEVLERAESSAPANPTASDTGNAIGNWASRTGANPEQPKLTAPQIGQLAEAIGQPPPVPTVVASPTGEPSEVNNSKPTAPSVPPPASARSIPVPPPIQPTPRSVRRR